MGYAQDFGAFAFDLTNKKSVNSVDPVAEFPDADESNSITPCFFLRLKLEIPGCNPAMEEELTLKTLFRTPISLDPSLSKSARNNRFLIFNILNTNPVKRVAIDMSKTEKVHLPNDISIRKNSEILGWLKNRK